LHIQDDGFHHLLSGSTTVTQPGSLFLWVSALKCRY